jgi:PEGA domain
MRFSKLAAILVLSILSVVSFYCEAESKGRRYYRYYSAWPYWGGFYSYPAFYYGGFYGAPYPYYHGYNGYSDRATSALRLEVKPIEAEVYVDGYLAGIVDEFDGFFQRLKLTPGAHEIVIFLEGHRAIREKLYMSPGASYKIRRAMEPLGPGETTEARPEPPSEPELPEAAVETQSEASISGFGILELRVQPPDSEVLIDGRPWPSGGASEALAIHIPAGEHRVEIRKAGHGPFVTDVQIDSGKTTTLNVRLP